MDSRTLEGLLLLSPLCGRRAATAKLLAFRAGNNPKSSRKVSVPSLFDSKPRSKTAASSPQSRSFSPQNQQHTHSMLQHRAGHTGQKMRMSPTPTYVAVSPPVQRRADGSPAAGSESPVTCRNKRFFIAPVGLDVRLCPLMQPHTELTPQPH